MEKFAVIIPDRNDRTEFTQFCFKQLSRMTRTPDEVFHINHEPIIKGFDLCERIFAGVLKAQEAGIDVVFIMENDDFYPANYFEKHGSFQADVFGDDLTYYYHIKNRRHSVFHHRERASLFTTGFRISKMQGFQWSGDQFLDIRLWKYATLKKLKRQFTFTGAIGIKHGVGLCGGRGHVMTLQFDDPDMLWLKSRVDRESYLFYSEMSRKLWEKELA